MEILNLRGGGVWSPPMALASLPIYISVKPCTLLYGLLILAIYGDGEYMRIGTTPTHKFTIPINTDVVKEVEVTYCQANKIILQKHIGDCQLEGNAIKTTLTQEDTFLFDEKQNVEIQVRVLDLNGAAFASNIMCVDAKRCLSKEVLV